jgi:cation diffusion facilitator CzcD-associated flavoprotein CzcO
MFRRLPESAQALRDELFWWSENRFPQRRAVPEFLEQISRIASEHLEAQVPEPALRELLRPDYTIGCKRILLSNDYYPALLRPNVNLEIATVDRVEAGGVRLVDGRSVDLDVLILATGFEASELPIAERVTGRAGELLASHWAGGGRAFACAAVHGFPNLFVMLGPNTGLGAGSIIYMVESQISYISGAIDHLVSNDLVAEPTLEAEERFVAELYHRAEGTVWLDGGCRSWYLHASTGRLTTLWPDFMSEFRAKNGTFSTEGYVLAKRGAARLNAPR